MIIHHTFLQHSLNAFVNLVCYYPNCQRSFKSFGQFSSHVRKHNRVANAQFYMLSCDRPNCEVVVKNVDDFYKNYYKHISQAIHYKRPEKFCCFYEGCTYSVEGCESSIQQRFYSHLSKFHRTEKAENNLKSC